MSRSNNERLSRKLVQVLRHKADHMTGVQLLEGGYVYVDDLLAHTQFHGTTEQQILDVVEGDSKQRFHLARTQSGRWKIRANQGHSMSQVSVDMTPITEQSARNYPNVIHGTSSDKLAAIRAQGLSRMRRKHIHFAIGEPGAAGVISGVPRGCDVLIYINLRMAVKDGLDFFISENKVILSPGNTNGVLAPKYFVKIVNKRTGQAV